MTVCIHAPLESAVIMAEWGEPATWDIPVPRNDSWVNLCLQVREGDEIAVVAESRGREVIRVSAVVITLDPVRQVVQVVA